MNTTHLHARTSLRAGQPVCPSDFAAIRAEMVLSHCKWDPQVEDESTLASFPLVLEEAEWHALAAAAESLARETLALEQYVASRADLIARLAVPRRLRSLFREAPTPTLARTMRFDFHPTDEGWRISEVNADVPGGYTEASAFPALMSAATGLPTVGDPAAAFATAVGHSRRGDGPVGLLSAAGFMEDHQVVAYLAKRLEQQGIPTRLLTLNQLGWNADGTARVDATDLSGIVRFYQAEWLAKHRHARLLFAQGQTPVTNPLTSALSESKRLPLVFSSPSEVRGVRLDAPSAWRSLLPESRDPRCAPWRTDATWLLKPAYCNTGDAVLNPALSTKKDWRRATWSATLFPRGWIAQRRFRTLALDTPVGPRYPCVGIYVIEGRAAGAYCRLSKTPVINYAAQDAALLLERKRDPAYRSPGHTSKGLSRLSTLTR